jgi:hypothetical protein
MSLGDESTSVPDAASSSMAPLIVAHMDRNTSIEVSVRTGKVGVLKTVNLKL